MYSFMIYRKTIKSACRLENNAKKSKTLNPDHHLFIGEREMTESSSWFLSILYICKAHNLCESSSY